LGHVYIKTKKIRNNCINFYWWSWKKDTRWRRTTKTWNPSKRHWIFRESKRWSS